MGLVARAANKLVCGKRLILRDVPVNTNEEEIFQSGYCCMEVSNQGVPSLCIVIA
jgi:hypothetical protein